MTYQPPPGQPYPSAPPPAQQYGAPPPHLRGRRPLQIGIPMLVLGVALLVVGIVVAVKKPLNAVDNLDRVSIAQANGSATFDDKGQHIAYYETPGLDIKTDSPPQLVVTLTSPSGKRMALDTLYGGKRTGTIKTQTYHHNGHDGAALYQFDITETGTYRINITSQEQLPAGADLAFGESIVGKAVAGVLVAMLGVLLLIAGAVLLIVGLVKRSRHKKQLRSAPYGYGYGSPAGPGAYPAPWQQPPAPQG